MQGFMITLGSMSIQASVIIVIALVLRKIFEKLHIGKKYMMLFWLIPFFCLVCPFKINGPIGFWQMSPVDVAVERVGKSETALGDRKDGKEDSNFREGSNSSSVQTPSKQEQESALPGNMGTSGNQNAVSADTKGDGGQNTVSVKQDTSDENQSPSSAEDGQEGKAGKSRILLWFSSRPVVVWVFGGIWLFGMLALLAGNIVRYVKLKGRLLCSIKIEKRVYIGDEIGSPIVIGFFRPRIYLPSGLPEGYRTYVLEHERTHIRRWDMFFKMAAYLITCIHWFNPIVWYGFYLFGKDMEMACDEETVRRIGIEEREAYAKTLLDVAEGCALKNKLIFVAPVAFEEGDVKSRIKNIMKYRKTSVALAVCAVVVCLLAVGAFVTKSKEREEIAQGQKIGEAGKVVLEDIIVKGEKSESKIKGDGGMAQYFAWINRIRNGMLENFQTVSVGDLGISDRFISSDLWRGNMGYAFLDLDSDGVYELLLGGNIKPDYEDPELNPIFGIYGLQDGQVVAVALFDDANDTVYLCENGAIAKETQKISEESDVYQEQYLYYRYQNLSLQLMEMLTRDTSKNSMEAWAYCEGEAGEAVTVKASKAWEIQKKYEPENVLFQILVKKEKLQKAREAEALRVVYPNPEKLAFSDLNGLLFSARNKELIIRPDGTFEGRYHFGRGGIRGYHFNSTAEECYFSGKISEIRKTGDYAYTMKCMEFQAEGTPGEERIIGDTLVTTFGLEDIFPGMRDVDLAKEEFHLYLPGMRESELPDGYEYWSLDCLEYGVLTSYVLVLADEVYEVYSLEDEPVYEIARSEYTMEPVTIPEAVLSEEEIADLRKETPVKVNFSFSDLKGEAFVNFRVGSSTFLEVAEDGTFTVTKRSDEGISSEWFSVAPKGIINEVVLKGEFYNLKRVGPYHYTIKCKSLKKEPAGKERLEDGYRFVTVEGEIPGFEKYDKFELYLPGYRITELPEGYFKWSDWDEKKDGILYSYYLYNVGTETMFQP